MSAQSDGFCSERLVIVTATALAFMVRVAWLHWAPAPEADSVEYLSLARNLLTTGMFSADGIVPSTYRPPLYPALLALVHSVGAPMIAGTLVLQCALGAATLPFVHDLVRPFAGRRGAAFTIFALAMAPMTTRYASLVLTETLFVLLIVVGSWAWSRSHSMMAGTAFGLATLTRALLWPFIIVLALYGLAARRGSLIRMAGIALVVVSPWLMRNAMVTKRLTIADAGW